MQGLYPQETDNVYYRCRKEAAKNNPNLNSREGAAKILGVSAESLRDYERGVTKIIPPDVILNMSKHYNAPELCNNYCHNTCSIGKIYVQEINVDQMDFDRLIIRLLSSFKDVGNIRDKLIEIAADGVISGNEVKDFNAVLKTLDTISKTTQELRIWAEKMLTPTQN